MRSGQCLQARVNGSGLPGVAKVLRRLSHTGQVLCLMAIDTIDQRQGFQHLERFARPRQKACCLAAILPLGTRPALAVIPLPMLHRGLGAAHHHGSNGHIEGRGNAAVAIWPHHADGAAVDAQEGWRSSSRMSCIARTLAHQSPEPHGEQGGKTSGSRRPLQRAGAGLHVRGHLPHGGQRLGVEQLGHPHRVRLGNA